MIKTKDKSILIIEDEIAYLDLLKYSLEKEGFFVNAVTNGNDVQKSVEKSIPDLVLLDMMLPGKSGFEIIKLLQAEEYKEIPVLVTTGKYTDEYYLSVINNEPNIKGFFTKPFSINYLLNKIYSILETISTGEKNQENNQKR